jgi:putative intracellular protease/amidase
VQRFLREAMTAAKLNHPNIVVAHDAEQVGDLFFLVMEYVEGISLDRLVRKQGPLPVEQACYFARQAALGLQHAHEKGMVHRDIKPQNLMVTRKGLVKVLDFGLARLAQEAQEGRRHITTVGTVVGTPDYIAPEQVSDSRTVDIRADVYSLGCTLYFLLAGQPPFPEGSALEKALSHLESPPKPLPQLRPEVPADLMPILDRMMAKSPDARYPTPGDSAQALAPFAHPGASPSSAKSAGPPVPVAVVAETPLPERADTLPVPTTNLRPKHRRKPVKNRMMPWVIVGGVLLGVVALGIALAVVVPRLMPKKGDNNRIVGSNPGKHRVLLVIPFERFWWKDYEGVHAVLSKASDVDLVVCSSQAGQATPYPDERWKREMKPVAVDNNIKDMKGRDFDAVIFIGGIQPEYRSGKPAQAQASRVIHEALDNGQLVTAVCGGPAILADAGVLRGKRATVFATKEHFDSLDSGGAKRSSEDFEEDGNLITGKRWELADQFAEKVLQRLRQKSR